MKKIIALLLGLVLMLSIFTACGKKDEPVTISIMVEETFTDRMEDDKFKKFIEYLYPEIKIEYISIPINPEVRDPLLTSYRTEIMSGKGPDIFLLPTWNVDQITYDNKSGKEYPRLEPLFKDMQDAMSNLTFLPMDDYLAQSEYINLEDHIKPVMDAGKNEHGQLVLPFTYSVDMFLVDKAKLRNPDVELESLEDIVNYTDKKLRTTLNINMNKNFNSFFAEIIAPDTGELTLTEGDIVKAFEYSGILFDSPVAGESIAYGTYEYSTNYTDMMYYQWMRYEDEIRPIVIYNMDGGVTAQIETYVAINGSTKHPDEAFKVVEQLFRDEFQSGEYIPVDYKEKGTLFQLEPDDLGREDGLMTSKAAKTNELNYNPDQVEFIESRITGARFTSEYDCMLTDSWDYVNNYYYWGTPKTEEEYQTMIEELAAELYSDFKMMAAE